MDRRARWHGPSGSPSSTPALPAARVSRRSACESSQPTVNAIVVLPYCHGASVASPDSARQRPGIWPEQHRVDPSCAWCFGRPSPATPPPTVVATTDRVRHMSQDAPMEGFPPARESLVNLENWQEPPFNRWSFQHLREVIPTQRIARGVTAARPCRPSARADDVAVTRLEPARRRSAKCSRTPGPTPSSSCTTAGLCSSVTSGDAGGHAASVDVDFEVHRRLCHRRPRRTGAAGH